MVDVERRLIEESGREPVLLYEGTVRCPACGAQSLRLREYLYEIPYFGRILIATGKCDNCGFAFKDVRLAEATKPKKITVRVEGDRELRYLLVKSAHAYLTILERNYELIPGPASTGFITTVEGVLHRFLEALELACKGREEDPECKENYEWLKRAIEGKEKFTLVICDYDGTSKVIGENVVEEPIDDFCLEKKPEWLEIKGL